YEEFVEAAPLSGKEYRRIVLARDLIVEHRTSPVPNFTPGFASCGLVLIAGCSVSVRQAKKRAAEMKAEGIGHPFSEEKDARLAPITHVRPHIQIGLRPDRFHEPFGQALCAHATQSPHGEGY